MIQDTLLLITKHTAHYFSISFSITNQVTLVTEDVIERIWEYDRWTVS